MAAIFLEGDARSILPNLPANFFHCCVTSPPYYGLRKYDGGEEIWDGNENCEHEWGSAMPRVGNEYREDKGSYRDAPVRTGVAEVNKTTSGNFCVRCGAWKGQLGAEPSPELYIQHLIQIMQEVKRVLRPDGVFWLNIGESWSGGGRKTSKEQSIGGGVRDLTVDHASNRDLANHPTIKSLDMVLIPEQLALAARADGWYVRSMVCWSKGNPMPMSVNGWFWEHHKVPQCPNCKSYSSFRNRVCKVCGWKKSANRDEVEAWQTETGQQEHNEDGGFRSDSFYVDCPGCSKCSSDDGYVLRKGSWRPTNSHEFILMLTKTDNYYCDKYAVTEPITNSTKKRVKSGLHHTHPADVGVSIPPVDTDVMGQRFGPDGGRNLRSVWEFPTSPGKFQHYAAYPPRLPEICIKASTSEKGCCLKCGAPWVRVIGGRNVVNTRPGRNTGTGKSGTDDDPNQVLHQSDLSKYRQQVSYKTVGWRPTCSCDAGDPVPCRVLDPMSGAGTTSLIAERLGRDSIGIDTSPKYIQMSRERLTNGKPKNKGD